MDPVTNARSDLVDPPALLLDPDNPDRELAPSELHVVEAVLAPEQLDALRRSASAEGRVLEREGRSVLTWGVAARLALPGGLGASGAASSVGELLGRIPGEEGALALGALPFDREAPGELVVPAVAVVAGSTERPPTARLVGRRAGADLREMLDQEPLRAAPPDRQAARTQRRGELADRFTLTSSRSHAEFRSLVAEAVTAVRNGELDKVVLAREVVVQANRPFQQADLLGRLRALHPSCLAFAVDGFVGASPELLCRRSGTTVQSEPLAGTVARSGDPEADAKAAASLFESPKERREHALVVEAIRVALEPHCAELEIPEVPIVLELRNVAHLATPIRGKLRAATHQPGALELAAALHPTPAVGGWPRAAALQYLAKHEALERDRYAGPVGFVEANGDGEFWLGIRSAQIEHNRARLIAGVGIVEGSDPAAELVETQLKLQALLAVCVRP